MNFVVGKPSFSIGSASSEEPENKLKYLSHI